MSTESEASPAASSVVRMHREEIGDIHTCTPLNCAFLLRFKFALADPCSKAHRRWHAAFQILEMERDAFIDLGANRSATAPVDSKTETVTQDSRAATEAKQDSVTAASTESSTETTKDSTSAAGATKASASITTNSDSAVTTSATASVCTTCGIFVGGVMDRALCHRCGSSACLRTVEVPYRNQLFIHELAACRSFGSSRATPKAALSQE